MNKQELIKHFEEMEYVSISQMGKKAFIDLIKQLDEPQKPVIPQFVAEWYEENKNNLDKNIYDCIVGWGTHSKEIRDWMRETSPFQTLVNMHQFGYTVEKEKRYRVKAKGVCFNSCLIFEKINKTWIFSSIYETDHQRGNHTRKELEAAGFGEVFNSPLFEVEEVEG